MKLSDKLYHLIKLIKLTHPVKVEFDVEAVIYEEAEDHEGRPYMSRELFSGSIDWEQAIQRHKSNGLLSFMSEDDTISVSLSLKKLSGYGDHSFRMALQDLFSKAMHEIGVLTVDDISFEKLFSLKQLIEKKNQSLTVSQYQRGGITFEVFIKEALKNEIPFEYQLGKAQQIIVDKLFPFCKQDVSDIPKFINQIVMKLDSKMIEIPKVRVSNFLNEFVFQDEIPSFKRLEELLIHQGRLTPEGLKMEKKEIVSLLYAVARAGYIRPKPPKSASVSSYRKKVRLAFQDHFNTLDLTEQAKPSKYKSERVSDIALGIDDFLKQEGKSNEMRNPLGL